MLSQSSNYSAVTMLFPNNQNDDSLQSQRVTESQSSSQEVLNDNLHEDGEDELHLSELQTPTVIEEEVILSVYWRKGLLGAAFYSIDNFQITVMNDIVDVNPEFNVLHSLFYQVKPTKVITSAKLALKFISTLKLLLYGDTQEAYVGKDLTDQSKLILLPGKDYHFEGCKRRILELRVQHISETFSDEVNARYISSLLELNAESMVFSLGCLLKCLDKSYSCLNFDVMQETAPVHAINTISLEDIVMMDAEAFEALQIFSQLSHPSSFKAGTPGSSKEGFSVFGMFNRCRTKVGSHFMRVMFLHPTRKTEVINDRLDAVQFCYEPKNSEFVSTIKDCLKHISNINRISARLLAARAAVSDWKSIHKTILYATLLGELLSTKKEEAVLFKKIAGCVTDDLHQAARMINSVIDFEESEKQNRCVVHLGIDEELDRKKQKYGCLPTLMTSMAQNELDHLPDYITECSVVYIPEIGYLLAIPFWKDEISDEEINIPGLQFMFQVSRVIHYKSTSCRELDTVLGDCVLQISEHESRIMIKLVTYIQQHLETISRIVQLAAELDCLIAFADVAKENHYVRPIFTERNVIEIKDGRHVLQEMCINDFVANDTFSGCEHGLMKILTGPNASGKSIYLKQVALIAYLCHIGSFVPASEVRIGTLSHIFTRIQTVESIAARLSAFMIDVKQMSKALCCSTPTSLVIVDEFGKGTAEIDGLALLTASLENFLNRGADCPHVFVSTHIHQTVKLLQPSSYLTLQTLEYMADRDGNIVYLYKLKEESTDTSFTLKVALSTGVCEKSIFRAQQVLDMMREKMKMVLSTEKNMQTCQELASAFFASEFNNSYDVEQISKYLQKLSE